MTDSPTPQERRSEPRLSLLTDSEKLFWFTGRRYKPSSHCRGRKGLCHVSPKWKVSHPRRRDYYCNNCLPRRYHAGRDALLGREA